MKQHIHSHGIGWAILILLALPPGGARGDEGIGELIDGVISRASSIHTIRLNFNYAASVVRNHQPLHNQQLRLMMVIEGSDWLVRQQESPSFRLRRNEMSVSYYEVQATTGEDISRSLHLEAPESLQDLIAEHASHAAPRLGGFWFAQQLQFIDRQRQQTRLLGPQQVGGVEIIELEWPVAIHDFDEALVVIPARIARARRGRLRIGIAPQLGHALLRIQYLADDGTDALHIETADYQDCGKGLFFPRRATCVTELEGGQESSEFELLEVSHVNQTLPPDDFSLQIPAGTRVRDSRPGVPVSVFYLSDQNQLDDLNRALDPAAPPPTNWTRVVLLVANSLFLITCLAIYVLRRCRSKSSTTC